MKSGKQARKNHPYHPVRPYLVITLNKRTCRSLCHKTHTAPKSHTMARQYVTHRCAKRIVAQSRLMQKTDVSALHTLLKLLTCVLICRIVIAVVLSYRDYMPPNFTNDFLQGRQGYFFGSYQWAFTVHITSGPMSLVLGMILLNERFRRQYSYWHRCIGRVQVVCVLLLVAPSGLWMAWNAHAGFVAETGFGVLAIATAACIALGWRSAVKRRFAEHRCWMSRCFALLFSAVVLRFIGGLTTVAGVESEWVYPVAAWACWVLPLLAYEMSRQR